MIKRVRKTNKFEAVRSDDRSIKVTLIGFNCEGKCRSIKPEGTKVFVELPCKANFSLLSFNHHEIEMSCDGEIVFGVPFNRNMSDVLEELAEEAHDNWVNVHSKLNFGRFNRSYEAELSYSGNGIIMLEVKGLDGDQEVEVEGEELPLSSFALAMDDDDLGASFDEIVAMLEESEDGFESVRNRRKLYYKEARKGVDEHAFDMSLMSLGDLLDSLDSVCRNEPQVPRYVWKCRDAGEALANGIDFVLRSNKKDLQKTMNDKRLSDFRPSFAIFAKEAENIRKEIDNPEGDYWSSSHDLRNFKEELEEVTRVLNAVL